jgi:hypothetical protein
MTPLLAPLAILWALFGGYREVLTVGVPVELALLVIFRASTRGLHVYELRGCYDRVSYGPSIDSPLQRIALRCFDAT